MANLVPEITFRVDLKTKTNPLTNNSVRLTPEENETQAKTKSFFFGNVSCKHNDVFTLYGEKAIKLKTMIDKEMIIDIYIDGTRNIAVPSGPAEEVEEVEEDLITLLGTTNSSEETLEANSIYTINVTDYGY